MTSSFTEDINVSLPGIYLDSIDWSDYNSDNKPDFLLTGLDSSENHITKLYKNTGSGFSEDTSVSLPDVMLGSVAWSDYNGDGKPDILWQGGYYDDDYRYHSITKLYKNTGSEFSEDTSFSLPDVSISSVTWSDYNSDNKPDFLLTGWDSSNNFIARVYKNTGSGLSEDTSVSLPGVREGSVAWSDYNGDNKPDFLLTGMDNSGKDITKLYKNTGSGFIEDTSVSLPGAYWGSAAWSDYNGDGKPDFLLTGADSSENSITKLYKNTGSGFIEDTNVSLPSIYDGSVAWSDYTGDGKPDFLLTGDSGLGFISKLYRNTGSNFIEDTSISLPGLDIESVVTWSDYNSDGKPDLLLAGYQLGETIIKLYKNTITASEAPIAISFNPADNAIKVAPAANLVVTFSEDIQKGSGKIEIKKLADDSVVETIDVTAANVTISGSQLTINPTNDLDLSTDYYVEITEGAIQDLAGNHYAGLSGHSDWNFQTQLPSSFSEDPNISFASFDMIRSADWSDYNGDSTPDLLLTGWDSSMNFIAKVYKNTGSGFSEDSSISLPGVFVSSVAWSDYNADNKPDFLLRGQDSSGNFIAKVYKNTGSGFSEDSSISLPGVSDGSVAWSDYTGDGKPDLLLTGWDSTSYSRITKLYKNTGNGFSEDSSISLPGLSMASVAWSDYNADNKPDLLLTGWDSSMNFIAKVYKNTGSGFSEDTSISLPGVPYSSVAWSDYNSDNKPDFLLTGFDSSYNPITKLYKNTGNGFSEDTSISLPGLWDGSVTWSDYNKDDKPDLLLTGFDSSDFDSSRNLIAKLYKNTGSSFSEDSSISLPGVDRGSVAWSDYNADNKPDFLLTALDSSNNPITKLYKNTGDGFSEDISLSLSSVYGSVFWSDYNGDGKPDFLLTGEDSSNNPITKLYKNITPPLDQIAPTVSSFTPADNATAIDFGANLVITFSEAIQKGTGKIEIKKIADNSVVETIGVTAANVTVSENQLTINPSNDFAENTDYYVEITEGAIQDLAGNNYAGMSGSNAWNFRTADTTVPTASSFTPADNAIGIDVGANLVINFSEAIQKGTGKIEIKKIADNSVVETIDVTAANVTVSENQLTINPINNLAFSTDYSVEISEGAIQDLAGNPSARISGNSAWNFQTQTLDFFDEEPTIPLEPTIPVATGFTPSDNAKKVEPAANLVINFSEAIQKGSGKIVIKKLADNSVVETIDIIAENITINGNQLTINPSADLESSTDYYLKIASGAIKDLAGNNYAGFSTNQGWNFQTADAIAPIANRFTPGEKATGVDVASNLVIDFNEPIQKGTGKILIKKLADNSVVETIDVTAKNVTVKGSQLTINPAKNLAPNTTYFLEIAPGAIEDLAGNDYAGMDGKTAWHFQTQILNSLTDHSNLSVVGVKLGSIAWSDYNGDKQPDFLLTGNDHLNNPITKLYKNTGNGFREDTSLFLPGVAGSSVAWSDYNGDQKPDFVLTGFDALDNPITKLYKNTGSGFSEDPNISLPGVAGGSVAWSDYNSDGKLDLLLTGFDGSYTPIAKLYQNTGSGFSEDSSVSLAGVSGGSVAWSDYTGDNKPDLVLTGFDSQYNPISKLYKNTGNGLIEDPTLALPGVGYSCVAWSDYNSDGKVDLLLTGEDRFYHPISKLYQNTGSGLREDTSISLPGVSMGSLGWSDYNSDGKADLLLTGLDRSNKPITKLYENTGNGLREDSSISLPGVYVGSVGWSDSNGDSKPDLLLTGEDSLGNAIAKLYHNTTPASNLIFPEGTAVNGTIGDDTLTGTANIDLLNGFAGNDILTGKLGADQFIYNTNAAFSSAAMGVDTIADFDRSQGDQIILDKTTFTQIRSVPGMGVSVVTEFAKVSTDELAASSAAAIVYNTATGGLFYNENGSAAGLGSGGQFLTLTEKPELTASEFLIQG